MGKIAVRDYVSAADCQNMAEIQYTKQVFVQHGMPKMVIAR
jgi:hypothetical protein